MSGRVYIISESSCRVRGSGIYEDLEDLEECKNMLVNFPMIMLDTALSWLNLKRNN